jgi:dienelactone hydrolase
MHLARCLALFAFLVALVAGVGTQRLPAAAAAETLVYKRAGVRCDTRAFPGAAHGFFNKDADGILGFSETLADADRFLISLGWLAAKATP